MAKSSSKPNSPPTSDQYTPIPVVFAETEQYKSEKNPYPIPTREEFARKLRARIEAGRDGRRNFGFDDMVRKYRRYHDLVVTPRSKPWPNASNIAPYIGRAAVDTLHATIYHTIFGVKPYFKFKAQDPSQTDTAQMREAAFQNQMENQIKIKPTGDDLIKAMLVDGTAITFTPYCYKTDKTVRMEKITGPLLAELLGVDYDGGKTAFSQAMQAGQPAIQQAGVQASQQAAQAQQAQGLTPDPAQVQQAGQQAAQQAQAQLQQQATQAQQQAASEEDQQLLELCQVDAKMNPDVSPIVGKKLGDYAPIWRAKDVVYDAPEVNPVDLLDYIVYPANSKSQKSDKIECRRIWRSRDALMRGKREGIYDGESVDALVENFSSATSTEEYMAGGDPSRTQRRGISVYSEEASEDIPYECYEGIGRFDVDGDGEDELIFFEMEANSTPVEDALIRCEMYPYYHGKSPFNMYRGHRMPETQGRYGDSLYFIMETGLRLYKKVMDQRIDRGDLVNNAPMVADQTIKHDWANEPWRPGMVIRARDPNNALVPVTVTDASQESYLDATTVMNDLKMAVGIPDAKLGKTSGDGSALGEIEAILNSTSEKMGVIVDRVRDDLAAVAQIVDYLNQQYHPEMLATAVGDDGTVQNVVLSAEQMMAGMGIAVQGTAQMNNPALMAQIIEKAFMLMERAGYTLDPVIKRKIVSRALEVYGIEDFEAFVPSLAEAMQQKKNPTPAPVPEKFSTSGKFDDVALLTIALKEGKFTQAEYLQAAEIARQQQDILLPRPQGAGQDAATDDGAGYSQAAIAEAAAGKAANTS